MPLLFEMAFRARLPLLPALGRGQVSATWRKSTAHPDACPHMQGCEMYDLFTLAGTLETWKIGYCQADFTRCRRYNMAEEGRTVPHNLMPNGAFLRK